MIASLTPNPSSQGYNERRQQLEISAFITNKGADPRLQNTLRGPDLQRGKTRTEGWGTPRYVSRSQEPPQGPLHLWSRRHLGPGVPAARTYLGLGSSSRVVCETGDGEAGTLESLSSLGKSPSRTQRFQPHSNPYTHFETENKVEYLAKSKNTAGRTPEWISGQRLPCPPVKGARANRGNQNHG